jgi:hypothetical protein
VPTRMCGSSETPLVNRFVPSGVVVPFGVAVLVFDVAGSPSGVAALRSGVAVSLSGAGAYTAAESGAAVAEFIRVAARMTFMFRACAVSLH